MEKDKTFLLQCVMRKKSIGWCRENYQINPRSSRTEAKKNGYAFVFLLPFFVFLCVKYQKGFRFKFKFRRLKDKPQKMDEEELLFGDVEVREETDEFAVNSILVTVEQFLLPTNTDASEDDIQKSKNLLLKKNFPDIDMSLSPRSRLDQICFQVTLADHIRTMQIMYKDTTDELQLAKHLRQDAVTLPTKHLQEKIAEGQARIIALCRLCYGDHSLEMLRATVDLASSYAQQGMWTQVSEHLSSCAEKMSKMLQSGKHSKRMVVSRCAAARVQCVYRILRQHAVNNCGQVNAKTFLRELISELNTLPEVDHSDDDSTLSYSTKLAALMHDFFSKFSINQHKYPQAKVIPKLIIVRENQTAADFTAGAPGPPKLVRRTPSWGDVIDYLRRDCAIMKDWMTSTEDALLPQQRAAVALAFRCADPLGKGVAHPAQLSSLMAEFPCCTRVVAGTPAAKQLQHMATEVSLLFDNAVGEVVDVASAKARRHREGNIFLTRDDSDHDNGPDTTQTVVYELPVTWEEVLSSIVLETYTDPLQLQQTQLLVLQGVHEIFSGNLSQSEEHLREGLRVFEEMGMEMEVVACELYNSIAQMMVIKYRQAEERKKQRVRKAATQWFLTEAGRKELRDKMKEIRTKFMMRQIQISPAEAEIRARNILYKAKVADIRVYMERSGTETSTKTIEAASRYLIRSHEILESAHGSAHPCVSTACLAVASVQNLAGKLENAREWLVLAMRCMLKCDPTPVRALAFAQVSELRMRRRLCH